MCNYLITPYFIPLKQNQCPGDRVIYSITYDLTLSVGVLKNKLKDILCRIQCYGDACEWLSLNSELKTFAICSKKSLQ